MKLKYILAIICCASFLFIGCEDDEGRVVFPYSSPEISNASYSMTNQAEAADSIFVSLDVKDQQTPLSTLEITLMLGEEELYSESIRTAGNSFQIKNHGIYIPFYAGFEEGEATLTITAINVEGSETTEVKNFTIKRPQIPGTIYLHYDGNVIPMIQSTENPFEYATESGDYPETLNGKISTSASLEDSKLIWGYSETTNEVEIGSETSAEFSFDYTDWKIEKITFNTFSFNLGMVGTSKDLKVNGTVLNLIDGYYYALINFEKGSEIETLGFEDLEGAYNRDFFDYNTTTGKLTFLRESGSWSVYYSSKYNYMWVARMDDVAPNAYWVIGHGFTCASVWHDDYGFGGWDLDNISRMGYAVKVGENKYQTTIYLSDNHADGMFDIQFYARRDWVGDDEMAVFNSSSFTGDCENIIFAGGNNADVCGADGFVPGYFQITLDISNGLNNSKLDFKRLSY